MTEGPTSSPCAGRGEGVALRVACILMAMAAATYAVACGGASSPTAVQPTPAPPSPTPTPAPTAAPPAASQPTPQPTPETCPVLTRWTSKIHNMTDASFQPAMAPVVGGYVLVDSTPNWGGQNACNAEYSSCGGRLCEDPRGGVWKLWEGGSPTEVRENGYQLRIGPLVPGHHKWQVCPRPDAEDDEGERVLIGPDPCTQGEFDVKPS